MKKIFVFVVVAVCVMVAAGASAAEKAVQKRWSDQAELSLVDTGGNTDVLTFSLKNELKYQFTPKWLGLWKIAVLYGESDKVKNAESYLSELRFDYIINDRLYSYGSAGWLKNEFAGIDPRYFLGAGLGYRFLAGPKHTLIGEAGSAYVMETYIDDTKHDYMNGRLFGKYTYAFTSKNSFSQTVEYLVDFSRTDNYNLISETALIAALTDTFSMKGSYTVKYDNDPSPSTLKKTDTILGVSLVANF
jgi:putative salt-induced outer membrane protein